MAPRHVIRSRRAEAVVGLSLFAVAAYLIRDAYDQRGIKQPAWLRPFSFW
jgi:hypothetical protein